MMIDLKVATICVILSAIIGTTVGFIGGYKNKKDIQKIVCEGCTKSLDECLKCTLDKSVK